METISNSAIHGTKRAKSVIWSGGETEIVRNILSTALKDKNLSSKGKFIWKKVMPLLEEAGLTRTQPAVAKRWATIRGKQPDGDIRTTIEASQVEERIPERNVDGDGNNRTGNQMNGNDGNGLDGNERVENEGADQLLTETVISETTIDIFENHFSRSALNFIRPKLKRIELNKAEKHLTKRLVMLKVDSTQECDARWTNLNAAIYAAIRTVADLRDEGKARVVDESVEKWFRNKDREIKEVRQWIGFAETERIVRASNSKRTPKQSRNLLTLNRYRAKHAKAQDLVGFVDMMKHRLTILKQLVTDRREQLDRQRRRRMAGSCPGFKSLQRKGKPEVDLAEATQFWSGIAKHKNPRRKIHPIVSKWVDKIRKEELPEPKWDKDRIAVSLKRASSWKAPGPDGIQAAYWKTKKIAKLLIGIIEETIGTGARIPKWLCKGRTVLIPKEGDLKDPSNYRPITCLNTCYKIMTGAMSSWLEEKTRGSSARPSEQRALVKGDWNCTSALLLDSAMLLDSKIQSNREIHTAWIDYAKAYDSLPHSTIKATLNALGLPPGIWNVFNQMTSQWRTYLEIGGKRGKEYRVQRGVLQGDALSPLLFVMSISPLSHYLNSKTKCHAYTQMAKNKGLSFNHQLYMDDLKLYARSEEDLKTLFRAAETATKALGMNINTKKCGSTCLISRTGGDPIRTIEGKEVYKYLGIQQTTVNDRKRNLMDLKDKVLSKSKAIFASELTIGQKVKLYNTAVVPVARYIFQNGIYSGHLESELKAARQLDKETRNLLVTEKVRFQKSNAKRLYVRADKGGLGMKSLETELEVTILTREMYIRVHPAMEPCKVLFDAMTKRAKRNPLSDGLKLRTTKGLQANFDQEGSVKFAGKDLTDKTTAGRTIRAVVEEMAHAEREAKWNGSAYKQKINAIPEIDQGLSNLWIRKGYVANVNLRNAFAIQEGQLFTRTHPGYTGTDRTCRHCKAAPETTAHILTTCKKWRTNWNINRHDAVVRNLHYVLCKKADIRSPHYSEKIPSVVKNGKLEVWSNQPVQTKGKIKHNRPDLIYWDNERKRALVIEVAISDTANMVSQEGLKKAKYSVNSAESVDHKNFRQLSQGPNLIAEIRATYGVEPKLLTIVLGTCGETMKGIDGKLTEHLDLTKDQALELIEHMQRSAVLGSSRIVKNHFGSEG